MPDSPHRDKDSRVSDGSDADQDESVSSVLKHESLPEVDGKRFTCKYAAYAHERT
jgi:hypothetical protein